MKIMESVSQMLKTGESLYYLEYLDHGTSPEEIDEIKQKPLILWCIGKILNLDQHHNPYYAIISHGSRYRNQNISRFEYVLKSAVLKKIKVHTIEE